MFGYGLTAILGFRFKFIYMLILFEAFITVYISLYTTLHSLTCVIHHLLGIQNTLIQFKY